MQNVSNAELLRGLISAYVLGHLIIFGLTLGRGYQSNNEEFIVMCGIIVFITWIPVTHCILILLRVLDFGKIWMVFLAATVWLPCLDTFILFGIHNVASGALRQEGCDVRFFGPKKSAIDSMKRKYGDTKL